MRPADEQLFDCFASKARMKGKVVSIGVKESRTLKAEAVCRGFWKVGDRELGSISWMGHLVMLLRASTTPGGYNHEWWGAQTFVPEWAHQLDEITGHGWLHFPSHPREMTAGGIGQRLGFQLALQERRLHTAVTDHEFLKKWEDADFQKATWGSEELASKTRVVLPGFDSWGDYAAEAYQGALRLRAIAFALVTQHAQPSEFVEFNQGFSSGSTRAGKVDLWEKLSEFNEREEVIEILRDHSLYIDTLPNRVEITKFVRAHLPAHRRAFLEDEEQWRTFTDRLRAIYEGIGLRKTGRGRPRKNRENDPI